MSQYKTLILDVSKWNTRTNLKEFKDNGFTGIIIRAGYGNNHIDPKAESWYKKAVELGMDVGAYWFSYAKTISDSHIEALSLLKWVKGKQITLPLAYDYEESKLGKKVERNLINSFGKLFCQIIEDAGYYSMFYSNKDYYNGVWDNEIKKKFDCWYARYKPISTIIDEIPNVHLAQFATSYKIGSKVISQDVNYDFIGLADLIKRKGLTGK